MNRRTALKVMGAAIICIGEKTSSIDEGSFIDISPEPIDFSFYEAGIRNLIIIKKGGDKITIPFSEIVKALEEDNPITP